MSFFGSISTPTLVLLLQVASPPSTWWLGGTQNWLFYTPSELPEGIGVLFWTHPTPICGGSDPTGGGQDHPGAWFGVVDF